MPALRTIEISFQLTQRELYEANVSIALHRYRRFILVLVICAVLISTMFVAEVISDTPGFENFTPGTILVTVLAPFLFVATLYASAYRAAKQLIATSPSLAGPTRWLFTDVGITTNGPGGSSQLSWTTYLLSRETKSLFLLYPQTNYANVIPKRAFADTAEIATFRELLASNGLPLPGTTTVISGR
jgi:hypothetical protein